MTFPLTTARLLTFPVATLAARELRLVTFPVTTARLLTFPVATLASRELRLVTFPLTTARLLTFPTVTLAARELKLRTLPVAATRFTTFEVPHTFKVFAPKITAEFAYRVVTFRVSILAVPRTYRFEPEGGLLIVPMLTPF